MQTTPRVYKQYMRTHPHQVLMFMRNEHRLYGDEAVGDYKDLRPNDFRNEVVFFLQLGPTRAGFISVRFSAASALRELVKVYVSPPHRKQGLASFALNRLKIGRAHIPVRMHALIGLCRQLGFQYDPLQRWPESMAELSRTSVETTDGRARSV